MWAGIISESAFCVDFGDFNVLLCVSVGLNGLWFYYGGFVVRFVVLVSCFGGLVLI